MARRARHGLVTSAAAHGSLEQMLAWSGLPTVNVRATVFVENPILTTLALEPLRHGELRLPFRSSADRPHRRIRRGELCVRNPGRPGRPHLESYHSPTELKDMHELAKDYSTVLGRHIAYVPMKLTCWNETYVTRSWLGGNPLQRST